MTLLIGHGGASALAPANTLASFDAALDAGADMVEFDVRCRSGVLGCVHLPLARWAITLDEALAHLAAPRFSGVGFVLDVKGPGYERHTLDALRSYGLRDRAIVSSQSPAAIDRVRGLDPGLQTAISVGGPMPQWLRSWSPRSWRHCLAVALGQARFGDIMLAHRLVDEATVDGLRCAGRRAFAWTVDEPSLLHRLLATGVDGVVTSNPAALQAASTTSFQRTPTS